jgi:predicted nucleotidyltransferase component of viral defense system
VLDSGKIREISSQKGILEIVVEKDYVLDWILWGISRNEYLKNRLVFKGGTALHKMYFADWRFSEDLDFTTVTQMGKDELEDAIIALCEQVKTQSGIEVRKKEIEASGDRSTEWFFEVKIDFIGPRKQMVSPLPIVRLHITHDELLIDKPVPKVIIVPYQDLPEGTVILTYSLEEILAEKIRTLFHQRCWPRDIYDTWRLLEELKSIVNSEKVLDIYYRKSKYRGFNPGIPHDLGERIVRIKEQWKEGLQRQISTPPDFDEIYPAVENSLGKLFKDYNVIKGGAKMLEAQYLMRYKKGDLEIEVQGDKAFVEEKFRELLELKPKGTGKETIISTGIQPQIETGRKVSLSEFFNSKNPKSHGDKILVFGYYLEKIMNESSFNLAEIERCYMQSRMPKTKNFRPYITQLIRDGFLMDAEEKKDSKKAWILTDSGIKYVEELTSE